MGTEVYLGLRETSPLSSRVFHGPFQVLFQPRPGSRLHSYGDQTELLAVGSTDGCRKVTLSFDDEARKKRRIEERKEAAKNAPTATPKQKPTASVPACHEVQGYMPRQLEFETEYFNEAEEAVQHMQFEPGVVGVADYSKGLDNATFRLIMRRKNERRGQAIRLSTSRSRLISPYHVRFIDSEIWEER